MLKAGAGQPVLEMGHITVNSEHLGSNSHGGWMFIRHTFQVEKDLGQIYGILHLTIYSSFL